MKANDIKVEQEDITNMAKEATRAQFAQYGMMSVPEEILENYSKEMLKKKESIEGLVNRVVESKLATAIEVSGWNWSIRTFLLKSSISVCIRVM